MLFPPRLVASLVGTAALINAAPTVQHPFLVLPDTAASNRQAVVTLFTNTFDAYKKYAYGHDDLAPLSETFVDGRNGWGATIVDSLSTMYIMGLQDLFDDGVKFVQTVDFSKGNTTDNVSVFESTIRYLGGMLSAYELSEQKYPILLEKAKQVADKMAYAWQGSNAIPYGQVAPTTNDFINGTSNVAEAGTLTLEWYTLSKYTGNDTYRALAEGSARHIAGLPTPLPGLPPQGIDPNTGKSVGQYITWGGGTDSYLEYLIKYPRLTGTDDTLWASTWATAVDSSIRTLAKRTTVGNWLYLADYNKGVIRHIGSHLACFYAGNWLLGGKLLNNMTIVETALELNDACWNTYASTSTGIGPEVFAYISNDGNYSGSPITVDDMAYYNKHGNYPYGGYSYYYLRPEVLESNFYAWRVTGNPIYLDRASSAIKSFQTYLQAPAGYAGLNDVNDPSAGQIDDTESFWYTEVLKYLYLTFDDPNRISLDSYVFNTEAQPLKAPAAKDSYSITPTATDTGALVELALDISPPLISQAVALPLQLVNLML